MRGGEQGERRGGWIRGMSRGRRGRWRVAERIIVQHIKLYLD
jgi:hypothetical protein